MPVLRKLFLVVVMLAGLCLLAYPHVASWLFERAAVQVTESYDDAVAETSEKDLEAAWREAVEYNENLYGNPVHDPFVEGSGMVMADNYYQVLDLDGTGVMGHISIPKISVELPIYHGTSESTLAKGVGHLEGSSMPTGGIGTHTVFTGHSGLVNAKLFTDLEELQEGDRFFVKVLDKTLAYEVDRLLVVEPEDTAELRRVADQDYCTLVTCTPYGINTHRLLVRGHRVDYTPEDEAEEAQAAGGGGLTREQVILIASAAGGALGVILVALFVRRKMRGREAEEAIDEVEQRNAAAIAAIAAAARAQLDAARGGASGDADGKQRVREGGAEAARAAGSGAAAIGAVAGAGAHSKARPGEDAARAARESAAGEAGGEAEGGFAAPGVPGTSDASDAPGVPGTSAAPDVPGVPGTSDAPDVPAAPDASGASDASDEPDDDPRFIGRGDENVSSVSFARDVNAFVSASMDVRLRNARTRGDTRDATGGDA